MKWHQSCTYMSCNIGCCKTKFVSVKAWNSHPRRVHRGQKLECRLCNKEFKTPSFLRDHRYMHSDKAFKCHLCSKVFAFKSSYQVHRRTHLKAKLFRCFAKDCKQEYKWAQDLHWHIQKHLKCVYRCNICDYTTHE